MGLSPVPALNGPQYSTGGSLTIGQNYYYWVTATDATGETAPSGDILAVPFNNSVNGQNVPEQTVDLSWGGSPGATGYNIYRSQTNDPTTATLIGHATGTTFSDPGLPSSTTAPPTSNYTYNPLNSYFNPAIDAFFSHYTAAGSFVIERDGDTFTGQVQSVPIDGNTYTALVLTSTSLPGQDFYILEPYFSNNTNIAGAPPAPSWLDHADQSPAEQIFAADGVFNTGGEQPGVNAGVLSDLENSVVSAFNRGIADNFSIAPDNWAAEPSLNSATAGSGGSLAAGTYYYVITGTNSAGQTTTSIERAAAVGANGSVDLSWTPSVQVTQYNIYRSQTQGGGYQLITSVTNDIANPSTGFTDNGSFAPQSQSPPMYYAPGSLSNWYSAFLHLNSTNNPTTGVSINSLAYGFPYDDQGGDSTDFTLTTVNQVNINLMPWGQTPNLPASTPTSIAVLTQPQSGLLGNTNSVTFVALNDEGLPIFGGTPVTVQFLNSQLNPVIVQTNPATGIGQFYVHRCAAWTAANSLDLVHRRIDRDGGL